MKKTFLQFNKAFTLAEVLITLVIVGVIAALTIPNIIYETKKHEYSARLKKFYSTMKQVELKARVDGKSWDDWAMMQTKTSRGVDVVTEFQDEYLLPYLSYLKRETIDTYQEIYLNDGSYFKNKKGDCIDFIYDVNGQKMPNSSGRDIFVFVYCPMDSNWESKGKFSSYMETSFSRSYALEKCRTASQYCSALLMIDGWEFKSDYPHRL